MHTVVLIIKVDHLLTASRNCLGSVCDRVQHLVLCSNLLHGGEIVLTAGSEVHRQT